MDISSERLITLSEAAALLPRRRGGKKTHVSSLRRWSRAGLRGIRLEVIRAGGVTCTSSAALQRFFDALTAADRRLPNVITPNASHRPSAAAVENALDSLGI